MGRMGLKVGIFDPKMGPNREVEPKSGDFRHKSGCWRGRLERRGLKMGGFDPKMGAGGVVWGERG